MEAREGDESDGEEETCGEKEEKNGENGRGDKESGRGDDGGSGDKSGVEVVHGSVGGHGLEVCMREEGWGYVSLVGCMWVSRTRRNRRLRRNGSRVVWTGREWVSPQAEQWGWEWQLDPR